MNKILVSRIKDLLKRVRVTVLVIFILSVMSLFSLVNYSCTNRSENSQNKDTHKSPKRLCVSHVNPHLLETVDGVPVFLNNYTAWQLIKNASREEMAELLAILKSQKFNMISSVLLNANDDQPYSSDTTVYGNLPFVSDSLGNPDPLRPDTTDGNDPKTHNQYDYWDHVDYLINLAASKGMYISLHPTWGCWVSGGYGGPTPADQIVFDETNAYKYGVWLGKRYAGIENLLWMVGGDRSAIYDFKDGLHDFRDVWRAMAEGLADGVNGVSTQNGRADYSHVLISYHPRKWAVNSSEWFHDDDWLAFNSIQDTPYDQIISLPHDYKLMPVKPTWLFEGRYEGATSAWAVRYQAYQTVLAGGFGSTYGNENWHFPADWREIADLEGANQMAHLYSVAREIWTDNQFLNRIPDQELILGDQGDTKGDGMTVGDGDGGPTSGKKANATSDRLTAMRGSNGDWALIYSANGRNISLDLTRLNSAKMNAYWFNPRNGMWNSNGTEYKKTTPFLKELRTGSGNYNFEAPGNPGPGNDWVLVLK